MEWQNNINSALSIEDAAAATTKLQQSMCALPVATKSLRCLRLNQYTKIINRMHAVQRYGSQRAARVKGKLVIIIK